VYKLRPGAIVVITTNETNERIEGGYCSHTDVGVTIENINQTRRNGTETGPLAGRCFFPWSSLLSAWWNPKMELLDQDG
jgi:hypothetical protein